MPSASMPHCYNETYVTAALLVVLALQGSTIDPEVDALSRAMSALQRRQLTVALAAIEEPPSPTDLLPDYRAWIRARILYALGRHEEARAALEGVAIGRHPLAVDVAELRARTYEQRRPLIAAELYAAMAPDGRLWSRGIELYRSRNDEKRAAALEERLLVEAAHSPEAKAIDATGKIGSVERRRTRVFNLLDTHANEEARAEAEALLGELPPKHPLACELHYARGKASRKLHDYRAAVEALVAARKDCARLAKETKPPKKTITSSTTWARAQESASEYQLRSALLETEVRAIRHDVRGTRTIASWIADQHPEHDYADDALFFWAEAEQNQELYQRIVEQHPNKDLAAEAAWRLAYAAIRTGDAERARALLSNATDPRGKYWRARMSEDTPEACRRYEEAITAFSFYTWLAIDRTAQALPECSAQLRAKLAALKTTKTSTDTGALDYTSTEFFARAKKLVEIPGFKVYGSLELGRLRKEQPTEDELLALAYAFDAIGDHRRAQLALRSRILVTRLSTLPQPGALRIWRAAYSRPFEAEIERAAKEQKIDPLLLYALTREESTFDPEVISWAGAVGLAQLMPKTAKAVHAQLGLGQLNLAKLTDPALNLRLGARVLRDGMRRFASSVPLALAAYNGGPGVVTRNLPPRRLDFDVWIESIPVKETRQYVKRVIQTYGIYHFLYAVEDPFIDLPDQVGRGK